MRPTIILLIILAAVNLSAQAQEANWITDFDSAKAQAANEKKSILMSFSGSDWCGNCIRLDKELFQTAEFLEFATKNLVLLKLDFPAKKKNKLSDEQTKHNEALAEKYNKNGVFPTTLVLNADGEIIKPMSYPLSSVNDYVQNLTSITSK
ncbi:MAG: thioredoxin family protein [Flavobacteriales bacterium]|nr:thioredoxin family protein [Flavobacteriales bacterium]